MRRIAISSLMLAAALAVASPAAAQFASPFHIIPVIAKLIGGLGTKWQSDGAITNLSGSQVTVQMEFFRENTNNTFTGTFSVSFTLDPGETRTVEDILGTYFPGQGNTKGILLIMADSGSGDAMLAVTTRTYNAADPDATYGQTVPSNFLGVLFGLGRSVLPGVSYDSRFRTNIGVCNLGPVPAAVIVDIYDAAGTLVASVSRTVESLSLRQWSLSDLGVTNLTGGRAEVRLDSNSRGFDPCDSGSVPFLSTLLMTYFSKVDNATGDAEFGYGQMVWDEFIDTCEYDPTDDCGTGGMSAAVAGALGLPVLD